MSDHREPDPRHLDDEALSRYLDAGGEEPTPDLAGWEAHLADCRHCAGRLRALDDARGALVQARVEAVDELTRRRMVGAALASAPATETAGTSGATGAAGRAPADPWWRRRSSQALAAAAAVLVVLGGVSVLADRDDDDSSLATAEERRDALAEAGGAALTGDVYVGDLGDLSESDAIRLALGEHEERSSAASGDSAGSGTAAGGDAGTDASDSADDATDGDTDAGTTESEAFGTQDAGAPPAGDATREDVERCLGQVAAPGDSPLALAGTGVFEGEDAVVLVFRTGAGGRALAMIFAASDCSILEAQSFD